MSAHIIDRLARHICIVDGRNNLTPTLLALEVEDFFGDRIPWKQVAELIERVNPGKRMGAGALAEAIVDHFNLDEENIR